MAADSGKSFSFLCFSLGLLRIFTLIVASETSEDVSYNHHNPNLVFTSRAKDLHFVDNCDIKLLNRYKRAVENTTPTTNINAPSTNLGVSTPTPDNNSDNSSNPNAQTDSATSNNNNTNTGSSAAPVTSPSQTSAPSASATAGPAGTATPPGSNTPITPAAATTPFPTFPPDAGVTLDDHKYYTSNIEASAEESSWIDLDLMEVTSVTKHGILSNSHRTAATIKLSFKFLFYGHYVEQVTIATGGFLYMSNFLHQWLTATQYVAPLMANFDTRLGGEDSNVQYMDNGTAFVAQWSNVRLQDQESYGSFTFQAALLSDGTVIFNYKKVPVPLPSISVTNHPVKIGFSDAYYVDRPIDGRPNVHRRTIYEYHRVELKKEYIRNGTSAYIRPAPTCIQMSSCSDCLSPDISNFQCSWCQKKKRCSDGMDRHRQEWFDTGCSKGATSKLKRCAALEAGNGTGVAVGVVLALFILAFCILAVGGWFYYAYKNPTTRSGMWLMEHRPSQLKMKIKFWKKEGGGSGDKYEVSAEPSGNESVA